MNVVDSSGWLEYFADGENASFFAGAIEDAEHLLVPVICIYEVFKRILQQRGTGAAHDVIADMYSGQVVNFDESLALSAAKISVEMKLAMADSLILATARAREAILWTQDADYASIEGVKYIQKSVSDGPAGG
jgi:predicted nucleic acid-binding protein